MLHDYGEYRENVIMPNVKKYTFADVKSSLNTVGAVATRTHKTHLQDIRSGSTSTYATRGYQCGMCSYLAIHGGRSISTSTEQLYLRVPGALQLHIPLLHAAFGVPTHLTTCCCFMVMNWKWL